MVVGFESMQERKYSTNDVKCNDESDSIRQKILQFRAFDISNV